jgi:stress response protein SCP2
MPMAHEPIPLMVSLTGRDRVLVALSWDERKDKAGLLGRLTRTHTQHDLDLCCFVFDRDGNYIDFVGAMAQEAVDQTGAIYHSGDDSTGEGLSDDESISCELGALPLTTAQIVFITEIRSGHTFGQVESPRLRVADGQSDRNLFELTMDAPEAQDKETCVMIRVFRDRTSPTGWMLQEIGEYPSLSDVSDWGSYLTRYLD